MCACAEYEIRRWVQVLSETGGVKTPLGAEVTGSWDGQAWVMCTERARVLWKRSKHSHRWAFLRPGEGSPGKYWKVQFPCAWGKLLFQAGVPASSILGSAGASRVSEILASCSGGPSAATYRTCGAEHTALQSWGLRGGRAAFACPSQECATFLSILCIVPRRNNEERTHF